MMRSFLMISVLLTLIGSTAAAADGWPQFRGPGGEGHSDATGLPLNWSETENVVWKTPVEGRAWSSPVVLDDQVWITTALETPASQEVEIASLCSVCRLTTTGETVELCHLRQVRSVLERIADLIGPGLDQVLEAAEGKVIHQGAAEDRGDPALLEVHYEAPPGLLLGCVDDNLQWLAGR